jgi:hypothetical protein
MTGGAFHTKMDPSLAHVTICRPSGLMRTCVITHSKPIVLYSVEEDFRTVPYGQGQGYRVALRRYTIFGEAKVDGPTLLMVPECPLPTASTTPSSHDHNYTHHNRHVDMRGKRRQKGG